MRPNFDFGSISTGLHCWQIQCFRCIQQAGQSLFRRRLTSRRSKCRATPNASLSVGSKSIISREESDCDNTRSTVSSTCFRKSSAMDSSLGIILDAGRGDVLNKWRPWAGHWRSCNLEVAGSNALQPVGLLTSSAANNGSQRPRHRTKFPIMMTNLRSLCRFHGTHASQHSLICWNVMVLMIDDEKKRMGMDGRPGRRTVTRHV